VNIRIWTLLDAGHVLGKKRDSRDLDTGYVIRYTLRWNSCIRVIIVTVACVSGITNPVASFLPSNSLSVIYVTCASSLS